MNHASSVILSRALRFERAWRMRVLFRTTDQRTDCIQLYRLFPLERTRIEEDATEFTSTAANSKHFCSFRSSRIILLSSRIYLDTSTRVCVANGVERDRDIRRGSSSFSIDVSSWKDKEMVFRFQARSSHSTKLLGRLR